MKLIYKLNMGGDSNFAIVMDREEFFVEVWNRSEKLLKFEILYIDRKFDKQSHIVKCNANEIITGHILDENVAHLLQLIVNDRIIDLDIGLRPFTKLPLRTVEHNIPEITELSKEDVLEGGNELTIERLVVDYLKKEYNLNDNDEFMIQAEDGRLWYNIYCLHNDKIMWKNMTDAKFKSSTSHEDFKDVLNGKEKIIKLNMD